MLNGALLPADLQRAMGMTDDDIALATLTASTTKPLPQEWQCDIRQQPITSSEKRKKHEPATQQHSVEEKEQRHASTTRVLTAHQTTTTEVSTSRETTSSAVVLQHHSTTDTTTGHTPSSSPSVTDPALCDDTSPDTSAAIMSQQEDAGVMVSKEACECTVDTASQKADAAGSLSSAIAAISLMTGTPPNMISSSDTILQPSSDFQPNGEMAKRFTSVKVSDPDKDDVSSLSSTSLNRQQPSGAVPYSQSHPTLLHDPVSQLSIASDSTAPSPDTNLKALILLLTPTGSASRSVGADLEDNHNGGTKESPPASYLSEAVEHVEPNGDGATPLTIDQLAESLRYPASGKRESPDGTPCQGGASLSIPLFNEAMLRHMAPQQNESAKCVAAAAVDSVGATQASGDDTHASSSDETFANVHSGLGAWSCQTNSCMEFHDTALKDTDDNDRLDDLESFQNYSSDSRRRHPFSLRPSAFQSPSSGTFLSRSGFGALDAQETLRKLLDCIANISTSGSDSASAAAAALALSVPQPSPTCGDSHPGSTNVKQPQYKPLDPNGSQPAPSPPAPSQGDPSPKLVERPSLQHQLFFSPNSASSQDSFSPYDIANTRPGGLASRGSSTAPAAMITDAEAVLASLLDSLGNDADFKRQEPDNALASSSRMWCPTVNKATRGSGTAEDVNVGGRVTGGDQPLDGDDVQQQSSPYAWTQNDAAERYQDDQYSSKRDYFSWSSQTDSSGGGGGVRERTTQHHEAHAHHKAGRPQSERFMARPISRTPSQGHYTPHVTPSNTYDRSGYKHHTMYPPSLSSSSTSQFSQSVVHPSGVQQPHSRQQPPSSYGIYAGQETTGTAYVHPDDSDRARGAPSQLMRDQWHDAVKLHYGSHHLYESRSTQNVNPSEFAANGRNQPPAVSATPHTRLAADGGTSSSSSLAATKTSPYPGVYGEQRDEQYLLQASQHPASRATDDGGTPKVRKVYTDDRDRMVYVSWIPKKARAYNTMDKRRMELDLKRRLREDLSLIGLTKVLLFPPKGVHCKLIFDCRNSASTFMEVYGGDNRSAETEKWKGDLCRIYDIDMHDKFDKTVVKIEWSQK